MWLQEAADAAPNESLQALTVCTSPGIRQIPTTSYIGSLISQVIPRFSTGGDMPWVC
ncbi:MAG: hypothetical protein U5K79_11860 [Cyclobacteriaceae bacterium]|nr:hypothetical protein [Cyclobacteriaceae bacterium]